MADDDVNLHSNKLLGLLGFPSFETEVKTAPMLGRDDHTKLVENLFNKVGTPCFVAIP